MKIDLSLIDEQGKSFEFDELSPELHGLFNDLLGDAPYKVNIELKALGNSYQAHGSATSHYTDTCSRCGYEVDVPINTKINEILVIEKERPRNTQVSQSRQSFDSTSPAATYLNDASFDLGEFIHEIFAASFEIYPACKDQEKCKKQQFQQQSDEKPIGHPGFDALKDFKALKN